MKQPATQESVVSCTERSAPAGIPPRFPGLRAGSGPATGDVVMKRPPLPLLPLVLAGRHCHPLGLLLAALLLVTLGPLGALLSAGRTI